MIDDSFQLEWFLLDKIRLHVSFKHLQSNIKKLGWEINNFIVWYINLDHFWDVETDISCNLQLIWLEKNLEIEK